MLCLLSAAHVSSQCECIELEMSEGDMPLRDFLINLTVLAQLYSDPVCMFNVAQRFAVTALEDLGLLIHQH